MSSFSVKLHFVRHAPIIDQNGIAYGREAEIDTTCTELLFQATAQIPERCNVWATSEFPRAQETARILHNFTGAAIAPMVYPAFNEQDFGDLAGKPKKEIIADPANHAYLQNRTTMAPPGGESVPAMVERVGKGLRELAHYMHAFTQDEAIIVCHGGVIRSVDAIHKNKPFDPKMKVPYLSVHSYTFTL